LLRQVDPKSAGAILIACQAWQEEEIGGAYKLAYEFASHLANVGYRVHLACGSRETILSNPVKHEGLYVWRYRHPRRASPSVRNLWGHLAGMYGLVKQIARVERVAFLNGHSPLQFIAASRALGGHVRRRVYSVHSPYVEEIKTNWAMRRDADLRLDPAYDTGRSSGSSLQNLIVAATRRLEQYVYRRADVIQCDSAYSLSVIKAQYPRAVGAKGVVCPGWVDLDRFRPVPDRNEARRHLGMPWTEGVPTFLSVRRLEGRMGLDALIEACAELRHEELDFQVLIGGTGPMYQELQQKIRNLGLSSTVHLLGRIPDQTLPLCYAAADCFVLPTHALECFGLIVLEALACNTPVIATPVGSIPEVMGPYGTQGWLSEDPSPRSIADRMRAFLDARLVAGNEAFRRHAEQYAASAIKPLLEDLVVTDAVTHMMSADRSCVEVAATCHNGSAIK
jgi:glycosyltransferase involved in cell wall biosynthesis